MIGATTMFIIVKSKREVTGIASLPLVTSPKSEFTLKSTLEEVSKADGG
jgi:hypothetical protein